MLTEEEKIKFFSTDMKSVREFIYNECHKYHYTKCKGEKCPLHNFMNSCEKRYRLGTL
ncbi:MAG: hypothetical protein WC979_03120 [Candidatus Pacearchaeota archaeon]|jgi:hypothetical protein|nr:hypothetical protein [Clostridia bacterium]